jgi:hypothetical protein
MSISVFCVFLAACGGAASSPELGNKTEVSNTPTSSTGANKKSAVIILDTLKAFPTAEGAGAVSTGGRGGKVVYVTNTNDDGEGSLQEALLEHGNEKRTIVFAVGGRFNVPRWYWSSERGNFTLAGQTAHDLGGVHLVSTPTGDNYGNGSYHIVDSENINVRYISSKGGWFEGQDVDDGNNALVTKRSNNVIYDHVSSGWSSYAGNVSGFNLENGKDGNVTMQYSLAHEGVKGHAVGFVLGSYYSWGLPETNSELEKVNLWRTGFGDVDFHHNAYILNTHRQTGNIYAGDSGRYKRVSNYIYGVGSRLDSLNGNMQVDYINNIYEANRAEEVGLKYLHKVEISSEGKQLDGEAIKPSLFFSGNRVIKRNGTSLINDKNQWSMVSMKLDSSLGSEYDNTPLGGLSDADPLPDSPTYRRTVPIDAGKHPITVTPTNEVKKYVLNNAGSGVRFNIDGSTYIDDELDNNYILIAKASVGPTNKSSIGDPDKFIFPVYPTVKRKLSTFDSDKDGLPDVWEQKHKVNDANATKINWIIQGYSIKNNAGYTNLEIYLAELAGDFHMLARK